MEKKAAFVISPIGKPGTDTFKRAHYALEYIFKKALDADEWRVHRADDGKTPDSISQHVIKSIADADLVIADLTGHNPNVFYELAVAHGFKKPVVHLITEGESIPFDIVDQRTIFYDLTDPKSVDEAIKHLRQYAAAAMDGAADLVTPLSNYATFNFIRQEQAGGEEQGGAVASLLEQILTRLVALEQRVRHSPVAATDKGPRSLPVLEGKYGSEFQELMDEELHLRSKDKLTQEDEEHLIKILSRQKVLMKRHVLESYVTTEDDHVS